MHYVFVGWIDGWQQGTSLERALAYLRTGGPGSSLGCVILGKSLHIYSLQFPHLSNERIGLRDL